MNKELVNDNTQQQEHSGGDINRVAEIEGLTAHTENIQISEQNYTLYFLSQEGCQIPTELKEAMVRHISDVVLTNQNAVRGDCASVAGAAAKALRAEFENRGYAIGTIGTESKTPISFYTNKGFGHHVINLIEGETVSAAVDLTASYTMDDKIGKVHVFGVIADSTADVEHILTKLTQTRWEAR